MYLALWTRKVLCGSFLRAIYKFSFIHSLHCLPMLVMKHFNTHNVRPRNILEPLTPETKLTDNWFYKNCVKRYFLCKSVTEVMFWFIVYVNESIESTHCERVRFQGSNFVALFTFFSFFPAAPDLELILFPLWYRPIMNAHTKQQQDKVFETEFIDSQKSDPPFAHLLAQNYIYISIK